jgi:hypothetical protein
MKRLLITCFTLAAFVIPSLAQVDHDYNVEDREPALSAKITKDQVPAEIVKAVNVQFVKGIRMGI